MIFVDTSFWFALRRRKDPNHDAARALLAGARAPLLTSNHVRGETWTLLNRREGWRAAVDFLDGVQASPSVQVRHADPETEAEALARATRGAGVFVRRRGELRDHAKRGRP